MGSLQGKVIIVTGASTGMGRAISIGTASEGATLGLVARNRDKLDEAASRVRATGAEVLTFPGNVADNELAKRVVRTMIDRFGELTFLSTMPARTLSTATSPTRQSPTGIGSMETNLTGAFLFTRQVLPAMRKAGKGQIINISSGAGLGPNAPSGVAYSASKHAIHSLTGSINMEERSHGIKACVIVPGETDTPNLDLRPRPPLKEDIARMMRPEDIANAVIYVASQPERVSVEMVVINPTVRRNYQADFERYVAEGHTKVSLD